MQADYITFPGLTISSADFVLTHGVTPSVCVATCSVADIAKATGKLSVYARGQLLFELSGCAVDDALSTAPGARRGARQTVRILDRRWTWRNKRLNHQWNVRGSNGSIVPSTRKNYRALLEWILGELGERDYTVSIDCPGVDAPEVQWVSARADLELAWLVARIGAVVILDTDDRVKIVQLGTGALPEYSGLEQSVPANIRPATAPKNVCVTFAPTVYQSFLQLEAVGMDVDGLVKPLDELSYRPRSAPGSVIPAGWAAYSPMFLEIGNFPTSTGYLAYKTVYKWYRIKAQTDGSLSLPDGGAVTSIKDLLPLRPSLVEPFVKPTFNLGDSSAGVQYAPEVHGAFYSGWNGTHNDNCGVRYSDPAIGTSAFSQCWFPFQLDTEQGIVMFDVPVFAITQRDPDTEAISKFAPASLWLLCSYHARDDQGGLKQFTVSAPTGASGATGEYRVMERDQFAWHVWRYKPNSKQVARTVSNVNDIQSFGSQVAKAVAKGLAGSERRDVRLVGLRSIALNGNVRQARWLVLPGRTSETTFSIGGESLAAPNVRERRSAESIENLVGDGYV